MKQRELVQLAHPFEDKRHSLAGMFLSEKLDGMRALWLPETCGKKIGEIGFANRERDPRDHTCTGLWSRYGKVIHAPNWFIGSLPRVPLDGELFAGRGNFQMVMQTVKDLVPVDSKWERIKYVIFDSPGYNAIYREGRVNNQNYTTMFSGTLPALKDLHPFHTLEGMPFERVYFKLKEYFPQLHVHPQVMLPFTRASAEAKLDELFKGIIASGGEGVILRNPSSIWEPYRTHQLVKVKPHHDAEAIVEGWIMGEGKYLGVLGSLSVIWEGKRFNLSGMKDTERFHWKETFPIGCQVTFRYRELTNDGIPKEARFLRLREKE